MRTRVTVVCLSVCYRSTTCLRILYNKMNIPGDFTLISKGFQLRDSLKSFRSRVTASIVHFSMLGQPFLSFRDCKRRTLHTWFRILPSLLGMHCESIYSALPSRLPSVAFLFSTSSCALAFSYRSQVELGRKVRITYTTSSHGLQLALVW